VARRRRTQKELAEVMHVSQQTVARRLSGELEFTVGELTRVAEFLDVPVERLLGIEARAS